MVLRHLDYGESDLIVTFYCREYGKIKGIAKGARRSRKRFANTLDLFSLSRIIFSRKDHLSLALIEDSAIISHFDNIRDSLENTLLASYMTELVDLFTLEGKVNYGLYDLLENYLGALNRGVKSRGLIHFFELGLLKAAGYEPVLDRCLKCGQALLPRESYFFSVAAGGLHCLSCMGQAPPYPSVSLGTLRCLLYGKNQEVEKLARIIISAQAARECCLILPPMIEHILGRKVKSRRVLFEVMGFGTDEGV